MLTKVQQCLVFFHFKTLLRDGLEDFCVYIHVAIKGFFFSEA